MVLVGKRCPFSSVATSCLAPQVVPEEAGRALRAHPGCGRAGLWPLGREKRGDDGMWMVVFSGARDETEGVWKEGDGPGGKTVDVIPPA